jgi:hypothetical protein
MRVINLCRNEPVITEFHNGKRTNKDIKEYQKKYREQKKKEREALQSNIFKRT